jgi:hypothetical protein
MIVCDDDELEIWDIEKQMILWMQKMQMQNVFFGDAVIRFVHRLGGCKQGLMLWPL